jgi:hypothetical protein
MKGRSGETALVMPEVSFAGQEPLTEDGCDMTPKEPMLDEMTMVAQQYIVDMLWIVQEISRPTGEPELHDSSMFSSTAA